MIAFEYYIEVFVWEILYFALFALSAHELYLHQFPPLKDRVKTLQKVWFPTATFVGIYGMLQGIDSRGVFGIYTSMPRIAAILWRILILIPPIMCGHVFIQQLILTACRTLSINGPFNIGVNEKKQFKILIVLAMIWLTMFITVAVLMGITNRLHWAIIIWAYVCVFTFLAQIMAIRVRRIVAESSVLTGRTEEVQPLLTKLLMGVIITIGILLVCLGAIVYHVTVGWQVTIDGELQPDPGTYSPSPVLYTVGLVLWGWCTSVIVLHGSIFHKNHMNQTLQPGNDAAIGLLESSSTLTLK
jgi:hypothetical protein